MQEKNKLFHVEQFDIKINKNNFKNVPRGTILKNTTNKINVF